MPPAAPRGFYKRNYGGITKSAQVWARAKVRSCGQVHRRPQEPQAEFLEVCSCHEVSVKKLQVIEEPWCQERKSRASVGCILEPCRQESSSMAKKSWQEAGLTGSGDVVLTGSCMDRGATGVGDWATYW